MFGLFTLLLTGISAYAQYDAQREQARYQRKQQEIQRNINALKERRAKVQAYKEMIRAQSEVTQTGVQSGTNFLAGSGYQGGLASIGSQFASNEAYRSELNRLQTALGGDRSKINRAQGIATLAGAGANLFGNNFGGYSEMQEYAKKLFN